MGTSLINTNILCNSRHFETPTAQILNFQVVKLVTQQPRNFLTGRDVS